MSENNYSSPDSQVLSGSEPEAPAKPGPILIIFTVLALLANGLLTLALAGLKGFPQSGLIGYMIGGVIVGPMIIVGLFQIGKRFRNPRSQLKIFFWTTFIVLFSRLGSIGQAIQQGS